MSAPGPRWSSRERQLGVFAALLVGCWALLASVLQPLWERAGELSADVDRLRARLAGMERAVGDPAGAEEAYRAAAAYLADPAEAGSQRELLTELESRARSAALTIGLRPRQGAARATEAFALELEVQGEQASVLRFVDEVLRLPRLISVPRVHMSASPGQNQLLRATLIVKHHRL
ncbi:MAG TPA: hypothetical protein VGB20_01330 [bacterium]